MPALAGPANALRSRTGRVPVHTPCRAVLLCLILLAVTWPLPSRAAAQSMRPRFTHLDSSQGLSHNYVYSLLQDQAGFMWFGTLDGLDRYDGYTFVVQRHRRSVADSLAGNAILALLQDAAGTFWIGTPNGLDSSGGAGADAGSHMQHYPEIKEQVNAIYQDRAGLLWIGTSGEGLYRYDETRATWTVYKHDDRAADSLSHDEVTALCEDDAGVLWVGTAGGLNALDRASGRFRRYLHDPADPHSLGEDDVRVVYQDRSGHLWVGTGAAYEGHLGGLNALDRATGQFTRYAHDPQDPHSLSDDAVTAIYEDQAGTLWVGTSNGLNILDRGRGTFTRVLHDPSDPTSPASNRVTALYEDRSGILWVGSEDAGLSRYARSQDKFARYTSNPSEPDSLTSPATASILEDRAGGLWVGHHNGGLDRLDPATGKLTHYAHNPADETSLLDDHVRALLEDRDGVLWAGSNGGLDRFDPGTGRFTHFKHDDADPTSLGAGLVRALLEDRDGQLWIGLQDPGSLDRFDRVRGTFARYESDPARPEGFPATYGITSLCQDAASDLWIGTYSGLVHLDPRQGRFTQYRNDPGDPASLSHDFVWSVHEDAAGGLWVGTGQGLDRLDRTTGRFTVFTVEDGLLSDDIIGLLEDERGRLWLSTDGGGIARFDPATHTFRNYDLSAGLAGMDAVVGVYHKGPSGRMYFGSMLGLTAFYPDQVRDNPYVPPVVLTAVRKFDQAISFDRPLSQIDAIHFSYRENFFAFEFAALDYTDPAKNRYAYRLDGFDRDWVQSGSRRYASYTNLPPGTYTFRVKGSNNDGVWNETGTAVHVIIEPAFWQTWWFKLLMGILLLGVVAVAAGVRLRYEAILRASETRFRALFDHAPLCVCEVDAVQRPPRIRRANRRAEEIYGRTAVELQNAPLDRLFAGHAWGSILEYLESARTGQFQAIESRGLRADGSEFPIRLSATRPGPGESRLMILAIEDITAEKERRSEEEAITQERRRIAREIHDGLAQDMAGLRFKVGLWRRLVDQDTAQMHVELDAFQQLLTRNLREIRRSIFALRPPALAELGFYPALRQFLAEYGEQNQLRIELHVLGDENNLPSALEPVLFRIVQESINNVGKHAQAAAVHVTLDLASPAELRLEVGDDGIGCEPADIEAAAAAGHLGLKQMRERVAALHGTFGVESRPGAGTTIGVSLPLGGHTWPKSAS